MPTYLHPGVYMEEIPTSVKPIEGVGTSTAIFIGFAAKGTVGEPVFISKWEDYVQKYDGYRDTGNDLKGDPMAYSVAAFFQNGGTKAYIARLAIATGAKPLVKATGRQQVPTDSSKEVIFTALNEGAWANGSVVQITPKSTLGGLYKVEIGRRDTKGVLQVEELFDGVSFDSKSANFIESLINGFSTIVTVSVEDKSPDFSSAIVPPSYMVGTSISDVLVDADLNFITVSDIDRTVNVTIDGGTRVTVVLPNTDYTDKLANLAQFVQDAVLHGAAGDPVRSRFTTGVKSGSIVLQSGTATPSSGVSVNGNAAARCRLDEKSAVAAPGVGTSISGDLSGKEPDFTGDDEGHRTLKIELDGNGAKDVVLPATNYASKLGELAKFIQDSVTGGAVAGMPEATFTALVDNNKLVLRSNTAGTSSVVVSGGAATKCQLGKGLGTETPGGGTLTSEVLTGTDLDFANVPAGDRNLNIALDGEATGKSIDLPNVDYTNDLSGLAKIIQAAVGQGESVGSARARFTADVKDGNKLVLWSNTCLDDGSSAVRVTGNAAAKCRLGLAYGGEEKNGVANKNDRLLSGLIELAGGADGTLPDSAAYDSLFTKLVKYRDINIVCLPGQEWKGPGKAVIEKAIAHGEAMRDRMVIIDPPSDVPLTTENSVNELSLSTSTYAVTYYPWIKAVNVYYNAETNPGPPDTVLVPPAGYAAGMWAKIDARRGVWKAPAGVETGLLQIASLNGDVDDTEQDALNPLGVNCLRKLPGFGPVIWGSRTLSTKASPEWRYVPVRRTAIFIEQSIYNGIQWAVFEGNDHLLWSSLRANIASFMDGLFRAGAFQGEKASDAYFVRCGLGDTMTQDDIDRGQVIVIVGFAPLKPAEFVIIRLQQKVNQQ